ncbi:MAG: hypothetical protein ACT4NY_32940 [Pseudonocardiales bacterium]
MQTVLKVLGIVVLVWIGFIVLGWLFKALFWVLVIGALVFAGFAAYAALTGKPDRDALNQ